MNLICVVCSSNVRIIEKICRKCGGRKFINPLLSASGKSFPSVYEKEEFKEIIRPAVTEIFRKGELDCYLGKRGYCRYNSWNSLWWNGNIILSELSLSGTGNSD